MELAILKTNFVYISVDWHEDKIIVSMIEMEPHKIAYFEPSGRQYNPNHSCKTPLPNDNLFASSNTSISPDSPIYPATPPPLRQELEAAMPIAVIEIDR
jgi:hypothetical protein